MKILILSANTVLSPDPVFPIGATYIATACIQRGHQVTTFDCNFKEDIATSLTNKINEWKPEVIGISLRNVDDSQFPNATSYTPFYEELVEICRTNSKATLIIGGSAFSLFPNELFEMLKPDYGIVGDGEKSFVDLVEKLTDNPPHEKIIHAHKLDMNKFEIMPDRTLFNFRQYYENGGMLNIQTKRGCVFRCSYCTYPNLEGFKLREKDPVHVVDELETVYREQGIRYFFIVDSVFNYPEEHALAICREIIKRKLKIKWSAYIRPQLKDLSILEIMKEAGCKSIELGTDSLAPETMASMKKTFTIDEVNKFCEKCRDVNIDYCHSLIFGAPDETFDTIKTTVRNVQSTDPTAIIAFVGIRVFPGTAIADYCIKSGYLKSEKEIGLKPVFYINKDLSAPMIEYLKDLMHKDKRWIIPGIEAFDLKFLQDFRRRRKKGLSWELKKFVDYID